MSGQFELEAFINACRVAVAADDAERAVRELVAEALAARADVLAALGSPEHAGFKIVHRAPEVTVLDFTWAPWMCFKPHNHNMWSVVGILDGREDNIFWRRHERTIEAASARSLGAGELAVLGRDVIHSVTNPIGKWTRAIHVYGGDFFAPPRPRSEWDHESLAERPWSTEHTKQMFADAEARFRAAGK